MKQSLIHRSKQTNQPNKKVKKMIFKKKSEKKRFQKVACIRTVHKGKRIMFMRASSSKRDSHLRLIRVVRCLYSHFD